MRLCDVRFYFSNLFDSSKFTNAFNRNLYDFMFLTDNIEKFIMSIQSIKLPSIAVNKSLDIDTPLGNFRTMENETILPNDNKITMQFLESSIPVHETFIWNWYKSCFNDDFITSSFKTQKDISTPQQVLSRMAPYPFLRLDCAIRIYAR